MAPDTGSTPNAPSRIPVLTTVTGLVLMVAIVVFQSGDSGLGHHAGYAGALWMFLPLFLGIFFLLEAWRIVPPLKELRQDSPMPTLAGFNRSTLNLAALAQVGLFGYVLFVSIADIPRLILGMLAFMLSVLILGRIALLLRLTVPKWLGLILMPIITLLAIFRGALHIITGNVGGVASAVGNAVVRLLPPLAPVAFLGKDLAGGAPIAIEQVALPLVYFVLAAALVSVLVFVKKPLVRVLATAVVLVALYFGVGFSTHRVDKATSQAIDRAIVVADDSIWPGYRLADMRFAVRDGKSELFFRHGEEPKRRPETIPVLAYTATMVDGEPTLHVLGFQPTRALYDLFAADPPQKVIDSYVGMLAHEGFHSFQFETMDETLSGDEAGETDAPEATDPSQLAATLDATGGYVALWNAELHAAYLYLEGPGGLDEYLDAREERLAFERAALGDDFDDFARWFQTMEVLEGTARYVEMKGIPGEERLNSFYLYMRDGVDATERPYTSGMARALILDRLTPDWKADFDFDELVIERGMSER